MRAYLRNPLPITRTKGGTFVGLRSPVALLQDQPTEEDIHKPGVRRLRGTQAFTSYTGYDAPYLNPDQLVGKKGFEIYSEMLTRDDMASAASVYLLLAAISPGYEVIPASDEPRDMASRDFHDDMLKDLVTPISQVQLNIADAAPRGFSIQEIQWGERYRRGDWVGKQPIIDLCARNPKYIEFGTDSYGAILDEGIMQLASIDAAMTGDMRGTYLHVPKEKVVYAAFWPRDDNPYGTPLLRSAYTHYFAKHFIIKQMGMWYERFAVPVPMGRVPPGTGSEDKENYLAMLEELRANLAAVVDNDMEVEFLNPASAMSSSASFDKGLQFHNRGIQRAMLLPTLVLDKAETGAYSLGESQVGQFMWVLTYVAQMIETVMNRQVIRRSHEYNFGENVGAPRFKFKAHKQDDLAVKQQVWAGLAAMGLPFTEAIIREAFDIPSVPEGEEVIARPASPAPQFPGATQQMTDDYTKMMIDFGLGKLGKPPTYSFPATLAANPNTKGVAALERAAGVADIAEAEDDSLDYWGGPGAVVFEEIADEIREGYLGKANGGRLPQ